MPSLEDFFEEAIEQADPANMVENEYKYASELELMIAQCPNQWCKERSCHVLVQYSSTNLHPPCHVGWFITLTMDGEPCVCCPGGVLTSSSPPTSSSRAWLTTWRAWSSNWPRSCRWVVWSGWNYGCWKCLWITQGSLWEHRVSTMGESQFHTHVRSEDTRSVSLRCPKLSWWIGSPLPCHHRRTSRLRR